jgi:cytochrome P450
MTTALYPPGPKHRIPGRNIIAFRRDPTGFLESLARTYGDVVHLKFGSQRVFLLNHPDFIRDVLVTHNRNFVKGRGVQRARRVLGDGLLTSEGALHLRQRRLIQPGFHRERIAAYGTLMIDEAVRIRAHWVDSATLDIHEQMMRLTLAVVGKTLFDADVEAEAAEIGAALNTLVGLFGSALMPFAEQLEYLPLPVTRRFGQARRRLDATIARMIAERRATGDRGDLLSMLLFAQDAGDDPSMSDAQVRDEAMTLFLAGHETTANALTWTWYLLSQSPDVEAQFHAEIDRVLQGRLPTVDDLPQLAYTRMLISESLRLYPPAWTIGRRAQADCQVGDYTVPAGSIVLMSQWVMHRDPRYYPDPERFDPYRWTPERQAQRPKFSYFPFGGGPRLCVGESFAWMEGVLLLATLAQCWRLRLAADQLVAAQPSITLRPRYGMRMVIERRAE